MWTLPDEETDKLWELASRMENDAPQLIKDFYRKNPQAPRYILKVTLEPGRFMTDIDYSLLSELELLHLVRKTSNFTTIITPPHHTQLSHHINNGKSPQKGEISLLPLHVLGCDMAH
jgi:hypothetical protein